MVAAPALHPRIIGTANDRLKGAFDTWLWGSIALAAAFHFAVLAFAPAPTIADWRRASTVLEVVPVPQFRPPPPPEDFPRPHAPVPGALSLADELTIPETAELFRTAPELPPPVAGPDGDAGRGFTPYTVAPELRDSQRRELQRFLERGYPPALRQAGIGARAVLGVHIDAYGRVQEVRIVESSGYPHFDDLASEGVRRARFVPALNLDQRVAVWIHLPIEFRVR